MTRKAVSLSRLRALLAAYGTDVRRFPESEREAARELLEGSESALAAANAERELDRLFAAEPEPVLSPELERRLNSIPSRERAPVRLHLARRKLWVPAMGWAAAAAFGLWLGAQPSDDVASTSGESTTQVEEEVSDDGSLLELAVGDVLDFEEVP